MHPEGAALRCYWPAPPPPPPPSLVSGFCPSRFFALFKGRLDPAVCMLVPDNVLLCR